MRFNALAALALLGDPLGPALPIGFSRLIERPAPRKLITAPRGRPTLNRAQRHPHAETYKQAAEIAFARGLRPSASPR